MSVNKKFEGDLFGLRYCITAKSEKKARKVIKKRKHQNELFQSLRRSLF